MEGDYPALRAQLTRLPMPDAMPPSVLTRLDAAALAPQETLLAQSTGLLEEAEFRTWFLTAEELRPFLDELVGVKDSPLVLNRAQQQERFDEVIERAIDAVFSAATRPSWARRLYEMGYGLAMTRRPERAAQAVAVARALEAGDAPRSIPFCAQLVRASLGFFFQLALEKEQEREKSALVLTPQQALARRGQREP